MSIVKDQMKTLTPISISLQLLCLTVKGQQNSYAQDDSKDSGGMGLAELIAIIVCGLIVLAFLLMCFIMVRNSQRRKKMSQEEKQRKEKAGDKT